MAKVLPTSSAQDVCRKAGSGEASGSPKSLRGTLAIRGQELGNARNSPALLKPGNTEFCVRECTEWVCKNTA